VAEEQGDEVGDPAVEGAGDAAHQRDGVQLGGGEARHCEGGYVVQEARGGGRSGGGSPDLYEEEAGEARAEPCEATGASEARRDDWGEHLCLSSSKSKQGKRVPNLLLEVAQGKQLQTILLKTCLQQF
jgi:hypothetical protein